jgi:hypothetical protein
MEVGGFKHPGRVDQGVLEIFVTRHANLVGELSLEEGRIMMAAF